MTNPPQYEAQVRAYVADCQRHRALLNPAYHPTADGAVKMIPHQSNAEAAEATRQAFATVTGLSAPAAQIVQPKMEAGL